MDEALAVRWRSFPLEQVNSEDEAYRFWEQPVDGAKSLRAFLAAEAVKDQSEALFQEFVFALLRTVHLQKMPVDDADTIEAAARSVPSLDVERMMRDMERSELRERIAGDYRDGHDELGVFGTPTLRFDDADAVFLKMRPPAPEEDSLALFQSIRELSQNRPFVQELKKPRRPEGTS